MHNLKTKKAEGKELTKFQAWLEENQPKYMEIQQTQYDSWVDTKEGTKKVKKNSGNGQKLVWKSDKAKAEYLKAKAEFKASLNARDTK